MPHEWCVKHNLVHVSKFWINSKRESVELIRPFTGCLLFPPRTSHRFNSENNHLKQTKVRIGVRKRRSSDRIDSLEKSLFYSGLHAHEKIKFFRENKACTRFTNGAIFNFAVPFYFTVDPVHFPEKHSSYILITEKHKHNQINQTQSYFAHPIN